MNAAFPYKPNLFAPKVSEELAQLVHQVQVQRRLGRRAAKRFVGRRANQTTLAVWRATGQFPLGFRRGSKKP